jgi:hypothetical protein
VKPEMAEFSIPYESSVGVGGSSRSIHPRLRNAW